MEPTYSRRGFLKIAGASGIATVLGGFEGSLFAEGARGLVRFPEKTDLLLLTSRPPQLETPLPHFRELLTSNRALFVRWHLSLIPTTVDLGKWRLRIGGNTKKKLDLTMEDLQKRYEKTSCAAVIQCSGNGRSFFDPPIPGGQWKHGSMGNVMWAGVRLKEILRDAGVKKGSVEVALDGLDRPPLPMISDYVKTLPVDTALGDDVLVAYEMNGEPLTMLNGFPARLVVPGWYATYWIKGLSGITVLSKPFEGFWMKQAYRIPDSPCACVPPGTQPAVTVPNTRMNTKSVVIDPAEHDRIEENRPVQVMGVAFSGGYPIREVVVSHDGGRTWHEARLGKDLGKYSWIQWFHTWEPPGPGKYTIMAKATNTIGESQPFEPLWNPSGYMWNRVERIEVTVGKGEK